MKYLILLSNNEIREVYTREDGQLMIVGVTSPIEGKGFSYLAEIKLFYKRHFKLEVKEIVEDN